MSKGNLSSHLAKLEQGELVEIRKQFVGKTPQTLVGLTAKGRDQIEGHWRRLEKLRKDARNWLPE